MRLTQPLRDTSVLMEERVVGGRQISVRDVKRLTEFFLQHFPTDRVVSESPSRIAGLAQFRDTKSLRNDTPEIINLRVLGQEALVHQSRSVHAKAITAEHGVFSVVLTEPGAYTLRGAWVLIENPTVFLHHDRVFGGDTNAFLINGRASNRLLKWIAASLGQGVRFIHAPDYDPTGLSEFLRNHAILGERIQLFVPEDLAAQFARYGNRALLLNKRHQEMLATLRKSQHPSVRHVVALMDSYNAGLEQEVLLLPTFSDTRSPNT